MQRGIPQVPMLSNADPQLRRFLVDLRESIVALGGPRVPPSVPTNLRVTPQAFANLVQWTRPLNADFAEVLWSSTSDVSSATAVDVGTSAQWTDAVGQAGIKRFYWVRARLRSGERSLEAGPISGTTLASGTGVAPPVPPPSGQDIVRDTTTGRAVPRRESEDIL